MVQDLTAATTYKRFLIIPERQNPLLGRSLYSQQRDTEEEATAAALEMANAGGCAVYIFQLTAHVSLNPIVAKLPNT